MVDGGQPLHYTDASARENPSHATDVEEWRNNFMTRGTLGEQIVLASAFLLMVISNVLSTASSLYNDTTNKIISDNNPTYITPDGVTFSVWGLIYAGECALVVYQGLPRCELDGGS